MLPRDIPMQRHLWLPSPLGTLTLNFIDRGPQTRGWLAQTRHMGISKLGCLCKGVRLLFAVVGAPPRSAWEELIGTELVSGGRLKYKMNSKVNAPGNKPLPNII